MGVGENMAAREAAAEAFELMQQEACRHSGEAALLFWRYLLKQVDTVLPQKPSGAMLPPMSDRASKKFGNQIMPFGKYEGKRIDEVPVQYLEYVCKDLRFTLDIHRYLLSDRVFAETTNV